MQTLPSWGCWNWNLFRTAWAVCSNTVTTSLGCKGLDLVELSHAFLPPFLEGVELFFQIISAKRAVLLEILLRHQIWRQPAQWQLCPQKGTSTSTRGFKPFQAHNNWCMFWVGLHWLYLILILWKILPLLQCSTFKTAIASLNGGWLMTF